MACVKLGQSEILASFRLTLLKREMVSTFLLFIGQQDASRDVCRTKPTCLFSKD